jgi:hypothetical protein
MGFLTQLIFNLNSSRSEERRKNFQFVHSIRRRAADKSLYYERWVLCREIYYQELQEFPRREERKNFTTTSSVSVSALPPVTIAQQLFAEIIK